MSSYLVNIRFKCWHFIVDKQFPWVSVQYNDYHLNNLESNLIEVYSFFGIL